MGKMDAKNTPVVSPDLVSTGVVVGALLFLICIVKLCEKNADKKELRREMRRLSTQQKSVENKILERVIQQQKTMDQGRSSALGRDIFEDDEADVAAEGTGGGRVPH